MCRDGQKKNSQNELNQSLLLREVSHFVQCCSSLSTALSPVFLLASTERHFLPEKVLFCPFLGLWSLVQLLLQHCVLTLVTWTGDQSCSAVVDVAQGPASTMSSERCPLSLALSLVYVRHCPDFHLSLLSESLGDPEAAVPGSEGADVTVVGSGIGNVLREH